MKNVYRIGDDLFVIMAFASFVIGIVLRLFSLSEINFGVNYKEALFFSMMCLLFSIALSLHDLNSRD